MPLKHHKEILVECNDLTIGYRGDEKDNILIRNLSFKVKQGVILFLNGKNGCGKSSLIKALMGTGDENMITSGVCKTASGLIISYIDQDTSYLKGSLKDYAKEHDLDLSLFLMLLRKLDMNRTQFEKNMEDHSEGQKKKILIAASLLTPAHLYIWDEPLNYIDVFSRMQIEKLIETYRPTMIMVEHDSFFRQKLSTSVLDL